MGSVLIFAQSGSLPEYFGQSNLAGKAIVVLLLATSLLAWTTMLHKYTELSKLRSQNLAFGKTLNAAKRLQRMRFNTDPAELGPYAALASAALAAAQSSDVPGPEGLRLKVGQVENALQRGVANETIRYESRMVLLGSIVTSAPFLGLFGTVWGVMDAFGGLAGQATATIQNLAPGVSGALLTTVAGLFVAIPSVLGYNFLLARVRQMITELENFASALADRLELEFEIDRLERKE